MKKDRLYFLTFLSITAVFLIVASVAVNYFIKISANQLIEVQVESSKREVNEIANFVNFQLSEGITKEKIIQNFQKTIQNTKENTWFVSLFNWSGKEVDHPDKTKIGIAVNSNQTLLQSLNEQNNSENLYDVLVNGNNGKNSEVIYISAVKNADWIIAAHANIPKITNQINVLKTNFYIIFAIMGFLVILLSFLAVRFVGSKYEKQLELTNTNLASEVINLSKLNTDLVSYKEKVAENPAEGSKEETLEVISDNKERIVTYIRNEIIPVNTKDISHIYTENTITYVVCFDGKRSTTNLSLDDLISNLEKNLFFRANRQFIINIAAIEKIIKYGNSQLKIVVTAKTEVEIIISKNKAAEFKQWLNS